MSASSSADLAARCAARPSARLTAVVDLPTPPLPDATAMIASTPGTPRLAGCATGRRRGCRRGKRGAWRAAALRPWRNRCGHAAALLLGGQRHHGAGDAGDRRHHALGGGAQRLELLGPLGWHGDREEHLAVGDEDVRNQPEADDIALEIGTLDGRQAFEDGFLGDGHGCTSFALPPDIVQKAGQTKPATKVQPPLICLLKLAKNSPASFFEVDVMRRLPSWAILPPTSAFAA